MSDSRLAKMLEVGKSIYNQVRTDSWVNLTTGFGTNKDKTMGGVFCDAVDLTDAELTALFKNDDIAAKIVDLLVREALRPKVELKGTTDDEKAEDYLDQFNIRKWVKAAWIWGRLYGGSVLWPVTEDDAMTLITPLPESYSVTGIKVIDKRYVQPYSRYNAGPKAGQPEIYSIFQPGTGTIAQPLALIHESRVILFGGAMTDIETKIRRNGWDNSVLQRPYDALRSAGNVWKATEIMVSDANQSVFKLQNLTGMMGGLQKDLLLARMQIMNIMRSVSNAIVLDKELEDFERKPTNFAGLSDLSRDARLRVSAAAEMPHTRLFGESAAGLNSTGSEEIDWWNAVIESEREQECEPRYLALIRFLLASRESPVQPKVDEKLTLCWGPLRKPTAKEEAEVYKLNSEGDAINITSQLFLPEEAFMARFSGDYSPLDFSDESIAARENILKTDLVTMLTEPEPVPVLPAGAPGQTPGAPAKLPAKVPDAGA